MTSTGLTVTEVGTGSTEDSAGYQGWRVLFASVIGLAFSPGPMIFGSLGLFAPLMQKDFGWGRGRIMLSLTVFNLAGVLVAPYTGRLMDRLGVRRVLLPSLFLFMGGFVGLAYLVQSITGLYVLAALWGALTVGTQSISYTKLLAVWFQRRRGLAVGIAAAGLGLGYGVVPLLVAQLLAHMSWHATLVTLALLILLVPTTLDYVFAHPRESAAGVPVGASGLSLEQARRTRDFWYMGGAILLASAALTGVIPNLAPAARDHGFGATQASLVASSYGLSTILGRVLVGYLADRYPIKHVAMLFFSVSAAGFLWAALIGAQASFPELILVALTVGLGFGAESDLIALFISRYFGQRNFGAIYGVLLAVFLVGAASGPPLFGYGRDVFGRYQPAMLMAALVMAAAILLLSRLTRDPKSQQ